MGRACHACALTAALAIGCAQGGVGDNGSLSGASSFGSTLGTDASTSGDTSSTGSIDSSSGGGAETTSGSAETGDTDCDQTTWYLDGDGDGRGDPLATTLACAPPPGYVPFGDDCDDADPQRSPAAVEICDAIDTDCDGLVDEASASNASCNGCTLFDVGGRSYAFCPAGAAFDAARSACAAFTGDLLRLDDEVEQSAVVALAEPPAVPGGGWFFGLSDAASEGTFVWIDGGGLDFTHWNAGEPNDAGGVEDCAEIDLVGGGWNDVPCTGPRAFVCESPAP